MPNKEVETLVDQMIANGRIQPAMRAAYIADIEGGLAPHLLRMDDYTKKTQAAAEERRQIAAEREAAIRETQARRQEVENWFQTARAEMDKAEQIKAQQPLIMARMGAYEQALRDAGYDPSQIGTPAFVPPTPTAPQPSYAPPAPRSPQQTQQPGGYLTKEEGYGALKDVLVLQGKERAIQARHYKLFGEFLDEDLTAHHLSTGEDPEAYWRVKYGIAAKEADIAARQREAERDAIRAEERAKVLAEVTADPGRITLGGFGQHDQGVAPVLAQYAASRALAHSENTPGGDPKPLEPMVPERKSAIQSTRESIEASTAFWNKHFDQSGRPINEAGQKMVQKHYSPD